MDQFVSRSDKKGRTVDEIKLVEMLEMFEMLWEETIGVRRMSRTKLQLLNKLRRRTEQMLGRELGIQGERGGYQRDIRILKWGKENRNK